MGRHGSHLVLACAGASHIGGQPANEDFYFCDEDLGLLAVADGMAPHRAARVAAETAVEALAAHVEDPNATPPAGARERLERALAHVNRHVREAAAKDDHLVGMATTLACALEIGKVLVVGHVGDSRVMRFRKGELEPLTTDHRRGTELTRAMGLADRVIPDICVEAIHAGDGILLATAGLTSVLDHDTVAAILHHDRSPRALADDLINAALRRTAPQNLTCVVGRWKSLAP